MKSTSQVGLWVLVAAFAAGTLAACGGDDKPDTVKKRDAVPFVSLRLKNTAPPGGKPATAQATGSNAGRTTPTPLRTGPVAPGAEGTSTPPGTATADSVSITVTFVGGLTFRGGGSYPGSFITSVYVECGEPAGGMATVNFANGQPSVSVPLAP